MIRKKLAELTTDMVLAQPVLGAKNVVLVAEGTSLSEEHLQKLRQWEIDSVVIAEPGDAIDDALLEKKEDEVRQLYQKTYNNALNCTKSILQNVIDERPLQMGTVKSSVEEMVDKVVENPDVLVQLTRLSVKENHLFIHAVNVCTYALVVGVYLDFAPAQLQELGTAALLHDIGMMKISETTWNHEKALGPSGWEQIKTHPRLGAEILTKLAKYPKNIIDAVAHHHERRDGSGYPAGLKGDAINFFGEIIGIVNIYDSLTAERKYRQAVTPNEAMKIILSLGENSFSPQILRAFVAHMAIYPIGSLVLLNTGEVAQVMGVTPRYPFRPRLKVLSDAEGNPQLKPRRIDLKSAKYETTFIVEALAKIGTK